MNSLFSSSFNHYPPAGAGAGGRQIGKNTRNSSLKFQKLLVRFSPRQGRTIASPGCSEQRSFSDEANGTRGMVTKQYRAPGGAHETIAITSCAPPGASYRPPLSGRKRVQNWGVKIQSLFLKNGRLVAPHAGAVAASNSPSTAPQQPHYHPSSHAGHQQPVQSLNLVTNIAGEALSGLPSPPLSPPPYNAAMSPYAARNPTTIIQPTPQSQILSIYPQLSNLPSCKFNHYPLPVNNPSVDIRSKGSDAPTVFFGQLPLFMTRTQLLAILNQLEIYPTSIAFVQRSERKGSFCHVEFNDMQQFERALFLNNRILFDNNGYWFNVALYGPIFQNVHSIMFGLNNQGNAAQAMYRLPHHLLISEVSDKPQRRPFSRSAASQVVGQGDTDTIPLPPRLPPARVIPPDDEQGSDQMSARATQGSDSRESVFQQPPRPGSQKSNLAKAFLDAQR